MTLLEEIQAKATAEQIAARDHDAIAAAVNVGRKRRNNREIGNGTILEVLGIATGNALLDVINNTADFRYVKPLIEQGRLVISSPLVQATVDSFVPAVLTQAQADALKALGYDADPVTPAQVAAALDGSA